MINVIENYYTKELLRSMPDSLFIFGDNVQRYGKGGQAIIRDEPNAVGVATKLSPSAYMTDRDLLPNINIITKDLDIVNSALNQGRGVFWPANGIGTGLSQMPIRCPHTFEILKYMMDFIFYQHGENSEKSTWKE